MSRRSWSSRSGAIAPDAAPGGAAPGRRPEFVYAPVYALVRTVPRGRVATYGQVAFVLELSTPRTVGRALGALDGGSDVPWHRIVNGQGRISRRREGDADRRQRARLAAEGVHFDRRGRLDFRLVGWEGPTWAWLEANGYDVGALIWRSEALARTGPWSRWAL